MESMTSKERILRTMRHEEVDHLPLCFEGVGHGWVQFMKDRYPDPTERICCYLDLGTDVALLLPGLGWQPPEDVRVRTWREADGAGPYALLGKEYLTPRGTLRQVVRQTPDYPEAEVVALSDYNVPAARSVEYMIGSPEHLDPLAHLFDRFRAGSVDDLFASAKRAREFCDAHHILLSMYVLGVGDPIIWMSGVERALLMALEEKETFRRYVDIIARWSRKTIEVGIDAGVDHFVRRGWYESADFWSPALYEEFLLDPLAREAELVHQAGRTIGYVMASGSMPLLHFIERAGVDLLSNIDPEAPHTNLRRIREVIGDRVALCGGVNNFEVIERGSADRVRRSVREAIEIFTPPTGCILAPSDSLLLGDSETIDRNFRVMIETWTEQCVN